MHPRYVEADPFEGGKQAVCEAYRNISATGAKPLAVTNNLNFGNPEKQDIMAQIVGSVTGMGKACKALDTPVVSGNVSLYNETDGMAIQPCPVIGMIGIIDDWRCAIGAGLQEPGQALYVVGQSEKRNDGWLGCSVYAREIAGREGGHRHLLIWRQKPKTASWCARLSQKVWPALPRISAMADC